MKSFRTLLLAAIRHALLVWGVALACLTYFSNKPSDLRLGWYIAAGSLIILHAVVRMRQTRLQARLAAS